MLNLLKDLLNIESFSGNEKPVREYILPLLQEYNFDDITIDDMGNILAIRGKAKHYPMLNAHMDSVKGYSTDRLYRIKALYEEVNENVEASKIKEENCSKCQMANWWTPSEYYCKGCQALKKMKEELNKKNIIDERSCRTCVYFTECIPKEFQDTLMKLNEDMTCRAYQPLLKEHNKEKKKKEFELKYDKKTKKLTSNETRPMGGDDKCGIAIALQVAKETDIPMKILFTVQEETGCNGVKYVQENNEQFLSDLKYSITIDRKHGNELLITSGGVRNCSNLFAGELAKWGIITGIPIKLENGSLADVCILRNYTEAVNISAGYYEPHRNNEYVKFNEVLFIKEWVKNFVKFSVYNKEEYYV